AIFHKNSVRRSRTEFAWAKPLRPWPGFSRGLSVRPAQVGRGLAGGRDDAREGFEVEQLESALDRPALVDDHQPSTRGADALDGGREDGIARGIQVDHLARIEQDKETPGV